MSSRPASIVIFSSVLHNLGRRCIKKHIRKKLRGSRAFRVDALVLGLKKRYKMTASNHVYHPFESISQRILKEGGDEPFSLGKRVAGM